MAETVEEQLVEKHGCASHIPSCERTTAQADFSKSSLSIRRGGFKVRSFHRYPSVPPTQIESVILHGEYLMLAQKRVLESTFHPQKWTSLPLK